MNERPRAGAAPADQRPSRAVYPGLRSAARRGLALRLLGYWRKRRRWRRQALFRQDNVNSLQLLIALVTLFNEALELARFERRAGSRFLDEYQRRDKLFDMRACRTKL